MTFTNLYSNLQVFGEPQIFAPSQNQKSTTLHITHLIHNYPILVGQLCINNCVRSAKLLSKHHFR